jgi:putative colanic acid biosynthesis acetyltransferase WcaF
MDNSDVKFATHGAAAAADQPSGHVDLSRFSVQGFDREAGRVRESLWLLVGGLLFRLCPVKFSAIKCWVLRRFGAGIGQGAVIKPGVRITFPWKLTVGSNAWLGEDCWLLNLAPIVIEDSVCISQRAFLCTGNHDHSSAEFDLITKPIIVERGAWIGAGAFVGPGVKVGTHAVLTAGSVATRDLEPYGIFQGNPATRPSGLIGPEVVDDFCRLGCQVDGVGNNVRADFFGGVREGVPIDQSKHSIFGASKVAGDIVAQEYGRYFGTRTCCLRGGCLTGANRAGVELHGLLSHRVRCNVEGRRYTRPGLRGELVRAGFKVLRLHYFNCIGYFAWWLNFCLLRKRCFEPEKVRFFDRAIFPLVHTLESRIIRPPFGQSLLAVAKPGTG